MIERSNYKQLLLESLIELMNNNPFNKITVRMISENASTTTRTFYNYFPDKYALLGWGLKMILGNCIGITSNSVKWCDTSNQILRALLHNRVFISSACSYIGQNDFKESLFNQFMSTHLKWIDEFSPSDIYSNDQILFALHFFLNGVVDVIYDWCKDGFITEPEELTANMKLCLPTILVKYFDWS